MTVILLAGFVGINAQSLQTANEGYVGYTFLRQDVKFERPTFRFNENTDSHGLAVGYTRYLNTSKTNVGTVGLTTEVAANFDTDEASLVTAEAGLILKGRNYARVQPSVRVLAGVGRQHINRRNLRDNTDTNLAYTAGAGLDFNLTKLSQYKLHTGVDLINTGFAGERQGGARVNFGLIF